jgi:hypothetical protein
MSAQPAMVATGALSKAEQIERNLDLARDHLQAILDNPDLLDEIPDGATVVLLPAGDPELFETNLRIAVSRARQRDNVYLRHVGREGTPLRPAER